MSHRKQIEALIARLEASRPWRQGQWMYLSNVRANLNIHPSVASELLREMVYRGSAEVMEQPNHSGTTVLIRQKHPCRILREPWRAMTNDELGITEIVDRLPGIGRPVAGGVAAWGAGHRRRVLG